MNHQPNYDTLQGNGNIFGKFHSTSSKLALIAAMSLVLLTTVPLYYPSLITYSPLLSSTRTTTSSNNSSNNITGSSDESDVSTTCNIFSGEWVPNNEAPYYTNETCGAIHEHQNCMKHGRPDTGYLKWRWKPDGCELPVFDPAEFLELVRDKSLAFVGDSVARNHMQSLICLLSRIEHPIDVSYTPLDEFKRWKYATYNFTIASFWTPHLVKGRDYSDPNGSTHTGLFGLYLDEFDQNWTTQVDEFDYLVLSAGQWFFNPTVFYEKRRVSGCHQCFLPNVTDLGMFYGFRRALRTAFRAIGGLEGYKGTTFLRTFAPPHYENGQWNEGGDCARTRPFGRNETRLEGLHVEMYAAQVEEFRAAEREARQRGRKLRLLDATLAALLRPDGHPSRYGHWGNENGTFYNDCVHWCLPGPIDTWNDFLHEMLKADRLEAADGDCLKAEDRKLSVR